MSRRTVLMRLILVVAALPVLVIPSARVQAANNSVQVIFSRTATPEAVGTFGPFGYWIWCQAPLTNPGAYAGQCSGSIYFYAIKLAAEHVDGTIAKLAEGQYQMKVHSADWFCLLTNTPPVTSGPTNTVVVNCSNPMGVGIGTGSIVHVTGP